MPKKSLRKEMRNLAVFSVASALLLVFISDVFYTVTTRHKEALQEVNTILEITAIHSQSALAFNDNLASAETLNALAPRVDIVNAEIIASNGEVLASRSFKTKPYKWLGSLYQIFSSVFSCDSTLVIESPVSIESRQLGKVKITLDTTLLWQDILASLFKSFSAIGLAILLSIFLVHRMVGHVMLPIDRLINSAKEIASKRHYYLRVEKVADNELGTLTDQFNMMLDEIESRDNQQLVHSDALELEVKKRTLKLRETLNELKDSELRWKFAIEGSADVVWDWDIQSDQTIYSKRWYEMFGYDQGNISPISDEWVKRIHPDDKSYIITSLGDYLEKKVTQVYEAEFRLKCKDGTYKWILSRGLVVSHSSNNKPLRMIGTYQNITEKKVADDNLRIAATAFESQEGMLVTDANNIILRINQAFTIITGYSAEDVIGQTPQILKSGRQDKAFYIAMWASINSTGAWEGEVWNRRKDGEIYPEHLAITAVKDLQGVVTNYVATLTDITLRKQAEERIQSLAFYDPLTNLPNRRLLLDRLKHSFASSMRSGQKGALLFLDLDHFKTLNDTLGHDIGDTLLLQVAERLVKCVREQDTVSRLGGDEFIVLLDDLDMDQLEAATKAEVIGEKILSVLNQPYFLLNNEYYISASIGAALFGNVEDEHEDLLKQADIAMYQAKQSGRNALRFFDPEMQASITARVKLEMELRQALNNKQFILHYQLQIDDAEHPLGAEALIRWHHPERGMISPFHFIPLAEETGLIIPIGQWVLETACAQLKAWEQDTRTSELTLSINVSAQQFRQPDFVAQVELAINTHGINPMQLKIELTESILLDNIDATIATMSALKALGVRFSLDDFGTGYSSLQYLKKLPLYQLKIDQSFVRDIAEDVSDQAIVRTIIAMAHTLNLNVIAEGVETEEQRQLLLNNGCKTYQGYLFSKPVSITEFEALLGNS